MDYSLTKILSPIISDLSSTKFLLSFGSIQNTSISFNFLTITIIGYTSYLFLPLYINGHLNLIIKLVISDRCMMGCADSRDVKTNPTSQPDHNNQNFNQTSIKKIDTASTIPSNKQISTSNTISTFKTIPSQSRQQRLSISDYNAFLLQSKQDKKIDYPTAFNLIKIKDMTDAELMKLNIEDIPALNCTRKQLCGVSVRIVLELKGFVGKIGETAIKGLIEEICLNYNNVSYHNFTHGFSLMQGLYKVFRLDYNFVQKYTDQQKIYYYIAGLSHDLNHPGTNNIFETKINSQNAKIAQNDAVLQKMHVRTFFQICKTKPQFDIVAKSTNPALTKQKITRAILATDMAKHFKHVQQLQKLRKQSANQTIDLSNQQNKSFLMQNLVHACDIGNGTLPIQQFMSWGALLTYQFDQQTKEQAKRNVPVTEFLRYKDILGFYDGQIGFLNTFVIPLWKQIKENIKGTVQLYQQTESNIVKIKELKEKQAK